MRLAITVMVIALVASMACSCFAGNNPLAKVAVHVRAHNSKLGCTVSPAIETCLDIVTTEPTYNVDAFPIFYELTEFKALEYGLNWPAEWGTGTFTSCSDLTIDGIVNPGDGVAHSWFVCQGTVSAPGFLWLYASAPGNICVVNNPNSVDGPGIYIVDCSQGVDNPMSNFCAGAYGSDGEDPCQDATDPTTWSAIKQIFR